MKFFLFLVILNFSYSTFSSEKLEDNSNQQSRDGTYVYEIPHYSYWEIKVIGSKWTSKFEESGFGVLENGEPQAFPSYSGIVKGNTLYDNSGNEKIGYFKNGDILSVLTTNGFGDRKHYWYTKIKQKN
jgi:hypothetical protein